MRRLRIYNRRYDESLIYRCDVALVDWGDDWLVWHARRGTQLQLAGASEPFTIDHRSIGYAWLKRPYYVVADFAPGGALQRHYCAVTLPPRLHGEELTLVSMDLGLLVPRLGAAERLGVQEFAARRLALAYPAEVETLAWSALSELERLVQDEVAPLDGSLVGYLPFVDSE